MRTYNLPIQNLDILHSLYQSTLCPDEINNSYSITATWLKLSELALLPGQTEDYFVSLNAILLKPNVCIIATKSSDFVLSYFVHRQFYTVKDSVLFNLAGDPVFIENIEIYFTPLAIPDFIVRDILHAA